MKEQLFFKLKIGIILSIVIGYGIYIIVKYNKKIKINLTLKKQNVPIIGKF